MKIRIKQLIEDDLSKIIEIQTNTYTPEFWESKASFASKLKTFPTGCWKGYYNNKIISYLFSFPWSQHKPFIELGSILNELPLNQDCYFIHDLSVSPNYQRKGIGYLMFNKAKEVALEKNLTQIFLIAVQDSYYFWQKIGFKQIKNVTEKINKKIYTYGNKACLMSISLK